MKKSLLNLFSFSAAVLLSFSLSAAQVPSNISPQQMEQFKQLPESQQRALAQSMGIDFNAIKRQLNSSSDNANNQSEKNQETFPKGTQFDEFGNPIFEGFEEELEKEEDEIKPFGYEIFANAPYTFAPAMDIAVPDDYIIGAGDTLSVQMFGKENDQYDVAVSRQGQIVIPQLGPFKVAGLTFIEAKKYLASEIKNKVLGVDVVITLSDLRSVRVFVAGDAFKPGPYVLSALSSITHSLFAAGGINDIGSLRNIQLKRAGKLIATLDLYDLLINGDSSNDVMLKSGDVVFIAPVGDRVTVEGEVKRPAIYEIKNGETFASIIKTSGGLLPSAYPSATIVERFNKQNIRTILNVDLSDRTAENKVVLAGDVVKVMKTSDQFEQSVTVIGAVSRPGKYQWTEGQKVSDLLPSIHSYMLQDADLNYSIIVREKDIGRNIEILQFGLFNAVSNANSVDNIELQPQDKILVFSINEEPNTKLLSLDSMAMTREDLSESQKNKIKKELKEQKFWLEYGINTVENKDEEFDYSEFDEKTTKKTNEYDLGLGLFSREKLLAPVITRLKRQSSAGKPLLLIEVAGAVKYPGIYPLPINGNINQMLYAAGGLLESAYLDKAVLTRNTVANNKATKSSLDINLKEALNGNLEHNIKTSSKDRLNVHTIPAWQENHIVELKGEFLFPGKYTIQRGETLGGLIERAGGFTDFAYIESSIFTREKLKYVELQNIKKLSQNLRMEIASKSLAQKETQSIDYGQAKLLLSDLEKVTPIGRLVIDLPKLQRDETADIMLQDGDKIYVPSLSNSINVIGQVQLASAHLLTTGYGVQDYISLSGGVKQQADNDRIYIIKGNGRVIIPEDKGWFAYNQQQELRPGDTIVVPLNTDYVDNLTLWSTGTQIIYQAAVAIAAISGL